MHHPGSGPEPVTDRPLGLAPDGDRPRPTAEQLAAMIDAVADYAIFMLDASGHIASWNTGARRIKGWTADEIIGQHFSRFYTPDDVARDHPRHELEIAAREGSYEEEGWRVRKDGSRFWASVVITAVRDDNGALSGFAKVTRDLTARRLAEEQLRSQAAELAAANAQLRQFSLLVSSVRDYAIFVIDAGGHVMTWNEGAQHIKGYTPDEIIGRHFSAFYTQEDRDRRHPANELEIAAREGRYEEEGWRVRKDGTHFWASVVITALRNEHGTLVGYAKVTRDLTERRETAERLRATAAELARSNAELERFAVAAAHDLTEPLQTIAGLADMVARRHADDLDDRGRDAMRHIGDGARRLQGLVDGLLAYSRASQQPMTLAPVASGEALQRVLHSLAARLVERNANIVADTAALPVVSADAPLLEIVFQNLLSNALKFTERDEPRIEVTAERDGEMWRFVIADNGIGIPEERQRAIFALFQRLERARFSGVGLGLALCQRLIERQGGSIGVDSTPGEGSRFWFTLPAVDDRAL
jgi:PAS domain S-box-containing protein